MHGRFRYGRLAKYPHMKPKDVVVWERFIARNNTFFETADYDFHVGEGADFLPTGEDTPEGRQNRLYQKKIDVVGYKGEEVWLIEVKPEANMTALGQVLAYKDLYAKTPDAHPDPKLAIVCGKVMNEMKDIFAQHGITIFVV